MDEFTVHRTETRNWYLSEEVDKRIAELESMMANEEMQKLIMHLVVERAFTLGNSHHPEVKPVHDWLNKIKSTG